MNARVVIITPSEEQEELLNDKYSCNTEDWLCGEGIDDKVGITVSCCNFMWVTDDTIVEKFDV